LQIFEDMINWLRFSHSAAITIAAADDEGDDDDDDTGCQDVFCVRTLQSVTYRRRISRKLRMQ